ncbi:MAG: hypothetical protein Q7K11_01080 [Candidatus Berkelbacteria bacterium]|nr:hypothetical protein [Candidatus Berkelbacteria bacterium]
MTRAEKKEQEKRDETAVAIKNWNKLFKGATTDKDLINKRAEALRILEEESD